MGSNSAAGLTCIIIMILVFFPLALFSDWLSSESLKLYQSVAEGLSEKMLRIFSLAMVLSVNLSKRL